MARLDIRDVTKVLALSVDLTLRTGLLVKSGKGGELSDSVVERTPEGQLHVNGYVWASLLRRALGRLKDGAVFATQVGLFHRQGSSESNADGLSRLWTEASFADITGCTAIVPGIKIDRTWGANSTGGLYSDEIVLPGLGLTLDCRWLCTDQDEPDEILGRLKDALWVTESGVETIGGGWSYGFGRLHIKTVRHTVLDLTRPAHRKAFADPSRRTWDTWQPDDSWRRPAPGVGPEVIKPWKKLFVKARILQGQLLAIHTKNPPPEAPASADLPDKFVYTRPKKTDGVVVSIPIVTGKAIRQALLSVPIERRLRSLGDPVCLDTTDKDRRIAPVHKDASDARRCVCRRCRWFGDTDAGGIISVADAEVVDPVKINKVILHRIQGCEHSGQTTNLFSQEYLAGGEFATEIIIDRARPACDPAGLETEIRRVLDDMKKGDHAPPGWIRLGATSTCTGQVEVLEYT